MSSSDKLERILKLILKMLKAEFITREGLANLLCVLPMIYLYKIRWEGLIGGLRELGFSQAYMQKVFDSERYINIGVVIFIMFIIAGSFFLVYRRLDEE